MTTKEELFRKMYKRRNGSIKNATKAWKRLQTKLNNFRNGRAKKR